MRSTEPPASARPARTAAVASVLLAVLAATGCTPEPTEQAEPEVLRTVTAPASAGELTVTPVTADGAADSAVQTSATLFESAPLVIVSGREETRLAAASAAVAIGVPIFDAPADARHGDALDAELDRLGTTTVVTVGVDGQFADDEADRRIIPLDDASSIGAAFGLDLEPAAADASAIQSIAALDPQGAAMIGSRPGPTASGSAPVIPEIRPGEPRDDMVALVADTLVEVAAAATARSAGAEVLVLPVDVSDLFSSDATMEALAASAPASVLAIGEPFATDPSLAWKVEVAVGGSRLPDGGVSWFPDHTLVAIYGVPGSASLGILGEQDVTASVARAQAIAAPYDALTDTTVVPTFEIITTVAAGEAGADGDFSNELPAETIAPWVQAAADAGMQVILDLQPGRTDFLTQAQRYEQLLKLPNVGLALDPEWRLAPDEMPLQQIGSVDASEVNAVTTWLADLTRDNALPQKPVVLHQFRTSMIGNRALLDTARPEVALLIHADGQGGQPDKQATWNALRADAPAGIAWGWKNFYDEDTPPLTPEQTMTQVVPAPSMVSYQ